MENISNSINKLNHLNKYTTRKTYKFIYRIIEIVNKVFFLILITEIIRLKDLNNISLLYKLSIIVNIFSNYILYIMKGSNLRDFLVDRVVEVIAMFIFLVISNIFLNVQSEENYEISALIVTTFIFIVFLAIFKIFENRYYCNHISIITSLFLFTSYKIAF